MKLTSITLEEHLKDLSGYFDSPDFNNKITAIIENIIQSPDYQNEMRKDKINHEANCKFQRYLGRLDYLESINKPKMPCLKIVTKKDFSQE